MNRRGQATAICFALVALVWIVFGQTLDYGFVNFDDPAYTQPIVAGGVTWEGVRWAFGYGHIGHWHPLTWMSHMLDWTLFGPNAGRHHLINVLLHIGSTIALFFVFWRATARMWPSAFIAAVFAIHPLRVESVAWIAERKDVLSALFFMLTLAAYLKQKRALVILFFALGLLSKNMLVTLPFVLLLLDYWPLRRLSAAAVREKIPLFLLSAASVAITLFVPEKLHPTVKVSFGIRAANAIVSYATYLRQMIDPSDLAVPYPYDASELTVARVAVRAAILIAITAFAIVLRSRYPYLFVGWFWYLGMLVPVIGFVQISFYARADRYTYLPQIGIYLMIAFGVADLAAKWRYARAATAVSGAAAVLALTLAARAQTTYWRDSETLWRHTLAVTPDNPTALYGLASAVAEKDRMDEAIEHLQRAVTINPTHFVAQTELGKALIARRRLDEAADAFARALAIDSSHAEARSGLQRLGVAYVDQGNTLLREGKTTEAIEHYRRGLRLRPDFAAARGNLGIALATEGRIDEAIQEYELGIRADPRDPEIHNNLGAALASRGRWREAIDHYRQAVRLKADYVEALVNLGSALVLHGDRGEGIGYLQTAVRLTGAGDPEIIERLEAAQAMAGR